MQIKTKYSVNDKVRFYCDDYDKEMNGVVKEVNVTISSKKEEIWYKVQGPMIKSSNEYTLKEEYIKNKEK